MFARGDEWAHMDWSSASGQWPTLLLEILQTPSDHRLVPRLGRHHSARKQLCYVFLVNQRMETNIGCSENVIRLKDRQTRAEKFGLLQKIDESLFLEEPLPKA